MMSSIKKELDLKRLFTAEIAYLAVTGMTCPHCATRINNKLLRLPGVLLSFVLFEQNLVALAYDPEQISEIDIAKTVSNIRHAGHYFRVEIVAHTPMKSVFGVLH